MSRATAAAERGYDDFAIGNFQNPYRARDMRRAWASGFRQAAQERRADVQAEHRRRHPAEQAVA